MQNAATSAIWCMEGEPSIKSELEKIMSIATLRPNTMTIADPNGIGADWTLPYIKKDLEGLNNRYENRNGHDISYSPKTKRGRRLLDTQRYNRAYRNPQSLADQLVQDQIVEKINEYEGVGGK